MEEDDWIDKGSEYKTTDTTVFNDEILFTEMRLLPEMLHICSTKYVRTPQYCK